MTDTDFLAARYAPWRIESADAVAAVTRVTGAAPVAVEPFIGGWRAKPFRVTAADGDELIVRVRVTGDEPAYEREAAVIARVRSVGIPAPHVLGVVNLGRLEASVQRVVPGRSLEELARERGVDDAEVVAATRHAGRILRAIHGTPIDGLALERQPDGGAAIVAERIGTGFTADERTALVPAAHEADRVLAHARRWSVPDCLLHEDFGPDHVFVVDGTVTGIIDWERARIGDPARDTSWWVAYGELNPEWPAARELRNGYGNVPRGFDARERAYVLLESVVAAAHGHEQQHPTMVASMAGLATATLAAAPLRSSTIEH